METTSAAEGAITPSLGWVSLLTGMGLLITPELFIPMITGAPVGSEISSKSEICFFLLDVSHVALILFMEAAACTDQRNRLGAESASHNLSLVD